MLILSQFFTFRLVPDKDGFWDHGLMCPVAVMVGRGSTPIWEWILVLLWKECYLSILSLLSLLAHVVEVWEGYWRACALVSLRLV